jgi:hypothetical protein
LLFLARAAKDSSRSQIRVDVDGFFVLQDYVQEKDGKINYRGHGIFGWDDQQKNVIWYWVDPMGFVPPPPPGASGRGTPSRWSTNPSAVAAAATP